MYLFIPVLKELYGGGGASASVVSEEFMIFELGLAWIAEPWKMSD